MNPTSPTDPWEATKVHSPPTASHRENAPDASGPQSNRSEWPEALLGVDTAAVRMLHPSKNELAKPWE
jgi:hypothetical protein